MPPISLECMPALSRQCYSVSTSVIEHMLDQSIISQNNIFYPMEKTLKNQMRIGHKKLFVLMLK